MLEPLRRLLRDEDRPTSVEYALMVTLVALAIVLGATELGSGIDTTFSEVSARIAASAR